MDDTDIDLSDKNIVGGLDRFVIWVGLAVIAVLPTLFIVLFMPWRAAGLVAGEKPEGREGYILGPGVFFVVAVMSSVLLSSAIESPDPEPDPAQAQIELEEKQESSAFRYGFEIGQRSSERTSDTENFFDTETTLIEGITSGNVWLAAGSISPYFFFACLIAAITCLAARLSGVSNWTMRAAVGAGLYFVTSAIVVWTLLGEIIDFLIIGSPNFSAPAIAAIGILMASPIALLPWQTFWFVKRYANAPGHNSGLVAVGVTGTLLVGFIVWSVMMVFIFLPRFVAQERNAATEAAPTIEQQEDIAPDEVTPPSSPAPSDAPQE